MYEEHNNGEDAILYMIQIMTHNISNPEVFCETEKFALETMTSVSKISVYDFFREYICPLASKEKGKVFAAKVLAYAGRSGTCKLFAKFINFFIYNEASLNEKFADAHDMSTYCAFMLSMDKSDLVDKTEMRSKESLFKINCPVDVDVIDRDTGEVVGRIRNNVVDEEFLAKPDSVVMTVNGDSKAAWLPTNGNYEVRLIGNGTGTMDCTVSTIGAEGTETARSGFFDVAIAPGLTWNALFRQMRSHRTARRLLWQTAQRSTPKRCPKRIWTR